MEDAPFNALGPWVTLSCSSSSPPNPGGTNKLPQTLTSHSVFWQQPISLYELLP